MSNLNIKKGDTVMVIAGEEKGKSGVVTQVIITDKATKVLVDGINELTHFVKPRTAQEKGGLIKKSAPINISNVALVCGACNKPVRVGHKIVDGKKIRVCATCGGSLEVAKSEAKKAVKKTTAAKKTTAKKATESGTVKKTTATKKTVKATEKPSDESAE